MKTPIQKAIEYVKQMHDNFCGNSQSEIISEEIYHKLNALLEEEKQVIEDSFNSGFRNSESVYQIDDTFRADISQYKNAEKYYSETFKTEAPK